MILTEETKKNYTGIGIISEIKKDGQRKYIGDYVDGKEHGIGMYTSRHDYHKYAGQFNEDRAEGIGIKIYENGANRAEIYCGQYKNNERNGPGYFKLSTGASFLGEFKNHEPNGFGIMITWDGLKFIGYVRNWSAMKGTWYDQEDNEIDITKLDYEYNGSKYVGEWKNGNYHGQGTLTFPDGRKYVGEWKDGKFHRQGTLTFPDGTKFIGELKDGLPNGQGTLTFPDGTKFIGELKDWKPWNGQGTYTFPDGGKMNGKYKDGEFIG